MEFKAKTTLPIILTMMILVVALIYALFIRPNVHLVNGGVIYFDATFVGRLDPSKNETVLSMGDALYVSTNEGLTKYALDGESIWNKSFHMNDQLFIREEPYMAIINLTGNLAYIFDENGETAEVQTDYPIVGGYINERGFLALYLDNDQENFIKVYDYEGEPLINRRTIFKKNGYPIDLAMSPDGTKMMTSHLKVDEHIINSNVTFLDFSQVGEEYDERIIGQRNMNHMMASALNFMDNTHGVIVGDEELDFYEINPLPSLLNTIQVQAKIEDVVFTDQWVVVSYGDAFTPEGEDMANKVIVYTTEGLVHDEHEYDEQVTSLSFGAETYYVILSSKIIGYNSNGQLWETTSYKPVVSIEELDHNQTLLIYDYSYEVVEKRDL